jgi:hypothetical protein
VRAAEAAVKEALVQRAQGVQVEVEQVDLVQTVLLELQTLAAVVAVVLVILLHTAVELVVQVSLF